MYRVKSGKKIVIKHLYDDDTKKMFKDTPNTALCIFMRDVIFKLEDMYDENLSRKKDPVYKHIMAIHSINNNIKGNNDYFLAIKNIIRYLKQNKLWDDEFKKYSDYVYYHETKK